MLLTGSTRVTSLTIVYKLSSEVNTALTAASLLLYKTYITAQGQSRLAEQLRRSYSLEDSTDSQRQSLTITELPPDHDDGKSVAYISFLLCLNDP